MHSHALTITLLRIFLWKFVFFLVYECHGESKIVISSKDEIFAAPVLAKSFDERFSTQPNIVHL